MKNRIVCFTVGMLVWVGSLRAQEYPPTASDKLSVYWAVSFHAFALPFTHLSRNFGTPGATIGISYAINQNRTLVPSLQLNAYANREKGANWSISTHLAYRPVIAHRLALGLQLGAGYQLNLSPSRMYQQNEEGEWIVVHRQSKGAFFVPIGAELGIKLKAGQKIVIPFVSYEARASLGLTAAYPLLPSTIVSVGNRLIF